MSKLHVLLFFLLMCLEQRKCNVSYLNIQEEKSLKAKHIIVSWKLLSTSHLYCLQKTNNFTPSQVFNLF